MSYVPRLKVKYREVVAPSLMQQFGYKSVMQIPKLVKISINQGIGDATQDKKLIDNSIQELSVIAVKSLFLPRQRILFPTLSCVRA